MSDSPQATEQTPTKRCPSCGQTVPTDALICPFCNYDFRTGQRYYPPAPYGYGPPPQPQTNGLAVTSMILGILGLVGLFIIGPILALVFGYISKGQIDASNGWQGGRGFAITGIILGYVGIALTILFVVLFVWIFSVFGPEIERQIRASLTPTPMFS